MNGNASAAAQKSSPSGPTPIAGMSHASTSLVVPSASRLVALLEPASVGGERFCTLAARLGYFQDHRDLKKLVITSAVPGEGKSLVAANLAISLARRQRTLLIDGDLRQPGLRELLGTRNRFGLTEWWHGNRPVSEFLCRVEEVSLWHLPAGQIAEQPMDILQSRRLIDMLAQASESFDWVIIDSPPLVPVTDATVWADHADGTLLVVRQGKTPRRPLQSVLESAGNLKLVGSVMNGAEEPNYRYYSHYYAGGGATRGTRPQTASRRQLPPGQPMPGNEFVF